MIWYNIMNIKYTFSNFIMNGIGADVVRIVECLLYCRMNGINLFMNSNDDWKVANSGNWKTLFSSLDLTDESIDEVDVKFLKKVNQTPMSFDQLSQVAREIFVPQKKYKTQIYLPNDYSVIHVRRGDKVSGKWREGKYHELTEYLSCLDEPYENIFVMTDSPDVAHEAKELGCMIDDTEERRDGYVYKFYHDKCFSEDEIQDELKIFFKNMNIFSNASKLVGSNASYYYVLGQLLNGKIGKSLSNNIYYNNRL